MSDHDPFYNDDDTDDDDFPPRPISQHSYNIAVMRSRGRL